MNKSLATNLISITFILIGCVSPIAPDLILSIGLFATSGAITNWLAVYMLFERIPGLYGSGVIPNRFEEIKLHIHRLIMDQFFNRENAAGLFDLHLKGSGRSFDPTPIIEAIDFDQVYDRLLDIILNTTMGSLLGMVVGGSAFEPLRGPFRKQMREEVAGILASSQFEAALARTMRTSGIAEDLIGQVDGIVVSRLNQLTPSMVKTIVQNMIRRHLGWLVVWGGVFGGAIGLVAGLVH